MITTQNQLPDNSRVWVYQSNRAFSDFEVQQLYRKLADFNQNWQAHGTMLHSAIEVFYNQFIVIFVDEAPQEATGCSIDKSVALIKAIESEFDVDLLDRLNITYKDSEGIHCVRMADFQEGVKQGLFTSETVVFNNLVTSKKEFIENWEVAAKDSWHKNLL